MFMLFGSVGAFAAKNDKVVKDKFEKEKTNANQKDNHPVPFVFHYSYTSSCGESSTLDYLCWSCSEASISMAVSRFERQAEMSCISTVA